MAASPKRVLLVQGSDADATVIEELLGLAHDETYELTHVRSLDECHQLQDAFDVMLLDVPSADAQVEETIERVRQSCGDLPLVVLVRAEDDDALMHALQAGADDHLVKGQLDPPLLSRCLRHAIDRRRIRALQNQLVHADRLVAIGQLAAGVAHEINNPAAYVLTNLTLIREEIEQIQENFTGLLALLDAQGDPDLLKASERVLSRDRIRESFSEIEDMLGDNMTGLERIRSITKSLRAFSRIERDEIDHVSINEVVEDACDMVQHEIRHRARLVKQFGFIPRLIADRGKLIQVLTNLLVNAAHAIEEGAANRNRITIKTEHRPGSIVVVVEDTGCGIAEHIRGRIFEPFFTTKARDQGTGLGLSLTSEIVRKHCGEISVASELGVGSRFVVTFPEHTGLTVSHPPDPAPAHETPAGRARVLIVDDEKAIRDAYRRVLHARHDVVTACGPEAIDLLEHDGDFDVVIVDLMMPDVDGPELYEHFEHSNPGLLARTVFCSGGSYTPRTREFLERVPNPVLEKPVSAAKLIDVVNRIAAGMSANLGAA